MKRPELSPTPESIISDLKDGRISFGDLRSRSAHAKNLADAEEIRKKRKFQCGECGHMRLGRHASGCSQA